MANEWKVKFTDDDEDGIQTASFNSCHDAEVWIDNQEVQNRYDNVHFKVVEGPYREGAQQVHESKEQFDAGKYVEEFKDYFGYADGYKPSRDYSHAYNSLAREIALQLPTDTEAREIEGDAVMLLVKSGDEEAVKAGKALGDCMMQKTKHDQKTLLKKMRIAFLALGKLCSMKQAIDESTTAAKIWVDDVRPAPSGYIWLKSVDDFINYVDQHGVEGIAVFDFDHDAGDYASAGGDYIRCLDYLEFIGAQGINVRIHSANPVGVKKMRQVIAKNGWNEVFDIIEESVCTLSEQEDSAAKRRIVDAVKKASKDFQKAASNNDPAQSAKIAAAFDDLAAAVGAYDFKAKKELKESQQLDVDATAMLFKKYDGKMVNWEKLTWPADDDGTLRQHVWMRSPDGVLVCRLDVYGEPSTYCIVDAAEEKLVEVGHGKTRGFTIFHFGYEPTHLEDIPDDIPTI